MVSIVTDRMWKLLETALEDLKKVEKDDRYIVYMGHWHWSRSGGKCYVCLAGSRLVGAGAAPTETICPSMLDFDTVRMLETLDYLRTGHIRKAYEAFYRRYDGNVLEDRSFLPYDRDREGWWRAMGRILQELKDLDL